MAIDLYYLSASPPCRAVLMTAKHLGVEVNIKMIQLHEGEHKTEAFLKMNPLHTVPTMDDNGFCLWESRAIMTYLVNNYAAGNSLYPNDPKERALVDKMLYFDIGTLYQSAGSYFIPQIMLKQAADPEKEEKMKIALGHLDDFLSKRKYVALDHLTLADLSILSSASLFEGVGYNLSSYPNIQNWVKRLKEELPYYSEVNDAGLAKLREFMDKK